MSILKYNYIFYFHNLLKEKKKTFSIKPQELK